MRPFFRGFLAKCLLKCYDSTNFPCSEKCLIGRWHLNYIFVKRSTYSIITSFKSERIGKNSLSVVNLRNYLYYSYQLPKANFAVAPYINLDVLEIFF